MNIQELINCQYGFHMFFCYDKRGLPQGVNRGKGGQKQVMTGAGAGEGESSSDCADDEASL